MAKYKIAEYPQSKYRFELYDNTRRLTWQQIRKETGCYAIVNLWYFALANLSKDVKYFDNQNGAIMLHGKWIHDKYDFPGLCISKDGKVSTGWKKDAVWDYTAVSQADYIDGKRVHTQAWGRNGATYTGLKADGTVVVLLASKDNGVSSAEAVKAMLNSGCVDVLRWDGSWSSQGSLGPGLDVQPSQRRICRGWLLVYPRETEKEEPTVDGITKKYTTQNPCYIRQVKCDKHAGMLHSTGTPGATAADMIGSWNKANADAAVEFVIDDTGVYQCLPLGIKSGHCGASANNTHVACEICEPEEAVFIPINWRPLRRGAANKPYAVKRLQQELMELGFDPKGVDGSFGPGCEAAVKAYQQSVGIDVDGSVGPTTFKYLQKREGSYLRYNRTLAEDYFTNVYGKAVALFAWLMKEISGKAEEIVCHSEGFKLGIASNHADVLHWFPLHGKTMDIFRADVAAAMSGQSIPTDPLAAAVDKLAAKGILTAPDYWKGGNYSAANVQALIIKMASAV